MQRHKIDLIDGEKLFSVVKAAGTFYPLTSFPPSMAGKMARSEHSIPDSPPGKRDTDEGETRLQHFGQGDHLAVPKGKY